jgi:hypothetical protein
VQQAAWTLVYKFIKDHPRLHNGSLLMEIGESSCLIVWRTLEVMQYRAGLSDADRLRWDHPKYVLAEFLKWRRDKVDHGSSKRESSK